MSENITATASPTSSSISSSNNLKAQTSGVHSCITTYYKTTKRPITAISNTDDSPLPKISKLAYLTKVNDKLITNSKAPRGKNGFKEVSTGESMRYDTSLGLLTKKFMDLLKLSPEGVVDLNECSQKLQVQKRRLYDITNVLEGIGILEKKSKNQIQWSKGNVQALCNTSEVDGKLRRQQSSERGRLKQIENQLDSLIVDLKEQFNQEIDHKYAYITCQDLSSIESLKDQLVISLHMPTDSKLTIPATELPREILFKSETEEIEAFMYRDAQDENSKAPLLSENTRGGVGITKSLLVTLSSLIPSSSTETLANVALKTETESATSSECISTINYAEGESLINDGKLFTSVNQLELKNDTSPKMKGSPIDLNLENLFMTTSEINEISKFMALEVHEDYNYSLGLQEGIMDLFDFI